MRDKDALYKAVKMVSSNHPIMKQACRSSEWQACPIPFRIVYSIAFFSIAGGDHQVVAVAQFLPAVS
jgi:hypothetical protein